MSSGKLSVWDVLERLGHRGDRDLVCQAVFEAVASVACIQHGGCSVLHGDDPMHRGDHLCGAGFLVEVFESLGGTRDRPLPGTAQWRLLREKSLRIVLARLALAGNLDAVAV